MFRTLRAKPIEDKTTTTSFSLSTKLELDKLSSRLQKYKRLATYDELLKFVIAEMNELLDEHEAEQSKTEEIKAEDEEIPTDDSD